MPELPEVETVRRGLTLALVGKRIERFEVLSRNLRFGVPLGLAELLFGARVDRVDRRAKYLLIRTERACMLSHLGMTGTWQHVEAEAARVKHDHLLLRMEGGASLVYNDPRRFGFVDLVHDEATHPRLRHLGPEPLDEARFNAAYLAEALRDRKAPLKSLLMDQRVVVGVGNIYATEALFRAGLHPLAKAGRVRAPRLERLVVAIREVLAEAIALGGSSIDDFRKTDGGSGYFQQRFAVYGREGEACRACGRALKHLVIGGRASVYCPGCQRV